MCTFVLLGFELFPSTSYFHWFIVKYWYALSVKIARIAFMHIFAVGESSPRVCHCLYASSLYGVVHTSLICIIFVAVGNWLHIDCLVRVTCTAPRGGACSRIKVYLCGVESPILFRLVVKLGLRITLMGGAHIFCTFVSWI
nr:MAG TPA: hypothetical protein [Crassvirales sp.]